MRLEYPVQVDESAVNLKIIGIAKMILASLLIIIALAYLLSRMKNKRIQKVVARPNRQIILTQQLNPRVRRLQHTSIKSSRFTFDDKQIQSDVEELYSMMKYSHQNQFTQRPEFTYSLKQAKINFLNNLKVQNHQPQSLIYMDKGDLLERQMRKLQREKKLKEQSQLIIRKTQPESKGQQKKTTPLNSQQNKPNNTQNKHNIAQIKPNKTQNKPPTGQKQVFTNKSFTTNNNLPMVNATESQKESQVQNKMTNNNTPINLHSQQQKKQERFPFGNSASNTKSNEQSLFTGDKPLFGQSQNTVPAEKVQNKSLFNQNVLPQTQQVVQKAPVQALKKTQKLEQPKKDVIPQKKPQILKPVQPNVSPNEKSLPFPQVAPLINPQPTAQNIQKKDYLQKVIDYSSKAKQQCQLKKTKTNNFGRSISNLKDIYDTAVDFINTINVGDSKQVETLACSIFNFLFNTTIPSWPKQQGWQKFPPRGKDKTIWKISINTFVLKINLYRAMGHQKIWLIIFGKLLQLLQFTWKRQQQIKQYKQLQLVKNKYFSLANQDDMANKYMTRLDLITYFLFCMTTFDPELVAQYLCQTAKQDQKVYQQIKKAKYKWSYSYFWILIQNILQNKTRTYFRPILYMNILSSIYLQIRKNKLNSAQFADFDHLKKYLIKQAIQYTSNSSLQSNKQISTLGKIYQENRDFRFQGEDFIGQIQTLNFYFKEKQGEYRKGIAEFQKRCSVFDYFKQAGGN